jgi:hypothetical protein
MATPDTESLDFDPSLVAELDHLVQPIPMLYLEIYEQTGRAVRGLSDHNHFALPIWRDLLRRMGAVRGTREICGRLFRLAIQHGVPIVPIASVGVENMFEIVVDAEDILRSPVGDLLRALGITDQPWFRHGEIIPPIARGKGFGPLPRLERQYFLFGEQIDTTRFAGRHEDRDACFALRKEVQTAIESQIGQLLEIRDADPERYPVQRLLRRLSSQLA